MPITSSAPAPAPWPQQRVIARNSIDDPRKKMHDPDVARRLGFAGGLVPGTVLYAHMLHPLVARFGDEWFGPHVCDLALLKPVYDGQPLALHIAPAADAAHPRALRVEARDESGQAVAHMTTAVPDPLPGPDGRHALPPAPPPPERLPVTWERIVVDRPLAAEPWTPDAGMQRGFCAEADEAQAIYTDGAAPPVHPGLVVRRANDVLVRQFQMELGIHVASRIVQFRAPRIGHTLEVRALPLEKWRRRGHEYVKLLVSMLAEGAVWVELQHTMIFRPRGAP